MATALSGSPPPSVNVTKYFGGSSRKWSKETILADHKDLQASAMGLSHHDNGQFALLGGRRYIFYTMNPLHTAELSEFYIYFLGTCH